MLRNIPTARTLGRTSDLDRDHEACREPDEGPEPNPVDSLGARHSHLRLVTETPGIRPPAGRLGGSLTASPFRPGELPSSCRIELSPTDQELVAERSRRARIPPELWTRTAVECARVRNEIAEYARQDPRQVELVLDEAIDAAPDLPVSLTAASSLRQYAALLERGESVPALSPTMVLHLSDEISGTWARTATGQRQSLTDWISEQVRTAPEMSTRWEISAARQCQTLAEWAYAAWLKAAASSSA